MMKRFRFLTAIFLGPWTCGLPTASGAERVVALGAPVTETVFALGAGDQLVARDASSLFPEAALRLPDVGYFRTISAEGVLAMRPTLILAAQGTGPDAQVDLLERSGVRLVQVGARTSAESTLAMIAAVGRALRRESEAAALVATVQMQFAEAAARAAQSGRRPKVVVLMGASGGSGVLQAAFDGTAGSALIELAGGANPFRGYTGYKTISAEELLAADPDHVFIATRGGSAWGWSLGEPANPPDWLRSSRAAREGRLRSLDMTYYLVFGPRSGEAALALAEVLHPVRDAR
jgi:iron complex transport system substrate-binding protein